MHTGALGWNGFLTFGMLYWLIPRLYKTQLYSTKLANIHFWVGLMGILFYVIPIYWGGVVQGLMWKEFTAEGYLQYPNFLDTVTKLRPTYMLRAVGGALYLSGVLIMVFNLAKTVLGGVFEPETEASAPKLEGAHDGHDPYKHRALERKPVLFLVLSLVAVAIGGLVEMIPMWLVRKNIPTIASVKPYTPLELEGRDIYVREGCYNCHSQMIRPFRSETERYGEYSKAGEFVYDHPFQWGSKRTGPDLQREGGKRSHGWHYRHMIEPGSMSPGSIMPKYPWLVANNLNTKKTEKKINVMRKLGVPYPLGYEAQALEDLKKQAAGIAGELQAGGINADPNHEIIALIAYLQRLGTDIKAAPTAQVTP